MKTLIPIIAIIALASCKKSYQCTFSQGTAIIHSEFIGTEKQKDNYEKAASVFVNGKQISYMKCQ